MKKICVITCYQYPDYVRGEVIRNSVSLNSKYELISVKNKQASFLRYIEVSAKLLYVRLFKRPDAYILTFRGYEMLPLVRLVTIGKKLLFDEFINPIEWLVYEHKKIKADGILEKILSGTYAFWLKRTGLILTDTKSHAEYSSKLTGIPISKYAAIPVGADEKVFNTIQNAGKRDRDRFEILYYGSMLPLHGINCVIKAAIKLSEANDKICFTLIGGKKEIKKKVKDAQQQGANIKYIDRVPLRELPNYIQRSDICLAGPFGKTVQSDMVITGKTFQFMAMSKPALIGRNKESKEFKDKINCMIVDQADTENLVNQIKWAVDNRSKLAEIGKNGHRLYKDKFSSQKISITLTGLLN